MTGTPTGYRLVDSVLSSRERADLVLSALFEGDVNKARSLASTSDDADSLLARGVLAYWLARTGTEYTYEAAKDLLSQASRLLAEGSEGGPRAVLADIWLGLCYWRLGQTAEALIILCHCTEAEDLRIRFLAYVNLSVIYTEGRQWERGLEVLERAQPLFEHEFSLSWRGKFFQQRGLCYKQAYEQSGIDEYLDRSLSEYEAASEHYERAGNIRFEAAILNNVAGLYRLARQFPRARNNADRAITLYERLGDRANLAQAKDTKALILFDQGDYTRSKRYADQAVALLRRFDPAWLIDVLATRARINHRLGLLGPSQDDFAEAISIAESVGDRLKASQIYLDEAETLVDHLSVRSLAHLFNRISELNPSRQITVAERVLQKASAPDLTSLKDLKTSEHIQERQMILSALEKARGSVTTAAKALGKTHGGLRHIIKTRHPDLEAKCRPVVRRRRPAVKSSIR